MSGTRALVPSERMHNPFSCKKKVYHPKKKFMVLSEAKYHEYRKVVRQTHGLAHAMMINLSEGWCESLPPHSLPQGRW